MANLEVNRMLAAAVAACEDKKAEDIRILRLDPSESSLTDYFLICNGTNDRQNVAITDEIEIRLKRDFQTYPNSVEGRRQGEWILMDYVDFIVHVFSPEKRAFYGLERLRKSATTLSLDELNGELRSAMQAKRSSGRRAPEGPRSAEKPAGVKVRRAKAASSARASAKQGAKQGARLSAEDDPKPSARAKRASAGPTAAARPSAKRAVALQPKKSRAAADGRGSRSRRPGTQG